MRRARFASMCVASLLTAFLGASSAMAADWWGRSSESDNAKEQKRYQAQMRTQLNAYDPQFLLAMQKSLQLKDDQVDKLQDVVDNIRKESKDILTKDQVKQVDKQFGTDTYTLNKLYDKVGKGMDRSGMSRKTADTGDDVAMCRGLSGMSMRHCQALASAQISAFDPQFLLANRGDLNLGRSQVQRLQDLIDNARQDARQVLTSGQRSEVDNLARGPQTMSDMRRDSTRGDEWGREEEGSGDEDGGRVRGTRVVNPMPDESSPMGGASDSRTMMMRYRGLMQSQIDTFDPQFVLALKSDLNLSGDQVKKLQSLMENERNEVKKILDPQQTSKLSDLGQTPNTMMEIHRKMMERMSETGGGSGSGNGGSYR